MPGRVHLRSLVWHHFFSCPIALLAPRLLGMSSNSQLVSYSDAVRTGASEAAVGHSGSYFPRRYEAFGHKQSLKPRQAQKSMPSMRHQVACRAETGLRLQERGVSKSHGGGEDEYRGLTRFGDVLVCLLAASSGLWTSKAKTNLIRAPASKK